MTNNARNELVRRGYSYRYAGTAYLELAAQAAASSLSGPRAMMTKEVYPAIARAANTSPAAVERAIRSVVHRYEPGLTAGDVIYDVAVGMGHAY